jgi:hypothetical protein
MPTSVDPTQLLAAYDDQLRTDAETPGAIDVRRLGQLYLATFAGGRGFVTYQRLDVPDGTVPATLIGRAMEHCRRDPDVTGPVAF